MDESGTSRLMSLHFSILECCRIIAETDLTLLIDYSAKSLGSIGVEIWTDYGTGESLILLINNNIDISCQALFACGPILFLVFFKSRRICFSLL
jgi:hypothetical protein